MLCGGRVAMGVVAEGCWAGYAGWLCSYLECSKKMLGMTRGWLQVSERDPVAVGLRCEMSVWLQVGRTLRTKEKPFEWTPVDGMPMRTSPGAMSSPVTTSAFLTAPTAKPAAMASTP